MEGGLDGMVGMIPMVIGAGIVMKVSERALGSSYDRAPKRSKSVINKRAKRSGKAAGKTIRKHASAASSILGSGMGGLKGGNASKILRADIGAPAMKDPHARTDMARMGSLSKKKFFPTHAPNGKSYKDLFANPRG